MKSALLQRSVIALLHAVILKLMDLEKFRLVLADVTHCAALIAAVFVADTVAFHVIPRLVDMYLDEHEVRREKQVSHTSD